MPNQIKLVEYLQNNSGKKVPLLIEQDIVWSKDDYQVRLDEGTAGKKDMIVSGVLQKSDVKNANGRIYPRSLWEKVLSDKMVQERIEKRKMFGHLDHPEDGRTRLSEVSHVVKKVWLEQDGTVKGDIEILPTTKGKDLMVLFEKGCTVGISSRAGGTTIQKDGIDVVNEDDFILDTWDFVGDPSTPGAEPHIKESKNNKSDNSSKEDEMSKSRLFEIKQKVSDIRNMDFNSIPARNLKVVEGNLFDLGVEISKHKLSEDVEVKAIAEQIQEEFLATKAMVVNSALANAKNKDLKDAIDEGLDGNADDSLKLDRAKKIIEGMTTQIKDLKEKGGDPKKLEKAVSIMEEMKKEYTTLRDRSVKIIEGLRDTYNDLKKKALKLQENYKKKVASMEEQIQELNLNLKAAQTLSESVKKVAPAHIPGKPTNLQEAQDDPNKKKIADNHPLKESLEINRKMLERLMNQK